VAPRDSETTAIEVTEAEREEETVALIEGLDVMLSLDVLVSLPLPLLEAESVFR
jgi:hypothetical protein